MFEKLRERFRKKKPPETDELEAALHTLGARFREGLAIQHPMGEKTRQMIRDVVRQQYEEERKNGWGGQSLPSDCGEPADDFEPSLPRIGKTTAQMRVEKEQKQAEEKKRSLKEKERDIDLER